MIREINLLKQFIVFCLVGCVAATGHFSVVILGSLYFNPFYLNPIGFMVGFMLSYLGQKHVTFKSDSTGNYSLIKYLCLQLTALLSHQLLFLCFHGFLQYSLIISLFLSSVTLAPITYFISKRCIF